MKVTVGKGDYAGVFNVHRTLLCENSDYFNTCLNSSFAEAASQEVRLDGEDAEIFAYFVKWLYRGNLEYEDAGFTIAMAKLYILAGRLLCPELKKEVVDALRSTFTYDYLKGTNEIIFLAKKWTVAVGIDEVLSWGACFQRDK